MLALRRWADAEVCFEQILRIDPVNAPAPLGLCQSLLPRRGNAQRVLDPASQSLGLVFHNPQGHYLCGVALQHLGRYDDARRSYETALSQNPVFSAAHRRLAKLYRLHLRDPDQVARQQELAQTFVQQVSQVGKILDAHSGTVDLMSVSYHDALADPAEVARRVNAFLGGVLDELAMSRVVDPKMRRQKAKAPRLDLHIHASCGAALKARVVRVRELGPVRELQCRLTDGTPVYLHHSNAIAISSSFGARTSWSHQYPVGTTPKLPVRPKVA